MGESGVVAFAFGSPYTIRSNQFIAQVASAKARKLEALVFTQRDVQLGSDINFEWTEEVPGKPPTILRMARETVRWANRKGLKEIWIACAQPLLWRCRRDMAYAIREARAGIILHVCEEVMQLPEWKWFCLESTQPRTNSRRAWRSRERILEILPMFIYKRVAS